MRPTAHILVVNGVKVRQPVFVLGAPHSGTGLLARALKRSTGFHVTLDRPGVLKVAYAFARKPSIARGRGVAAARVLRDAFAEAWQINAHACLRCPAECRDAGGLDGAGPCVNVWDVVRFGDASSDLLYSADVLVDAFPDARLVQIVRDGRDVVADMLRDERSLAWFKPGFANVDSEFPNPFFGVHSESDRAAWRELTLAGKCALRWRGAVRHSARLRVELPREQLMTVRYEQLVAEPVEVIRDVAAFLGAHVSASAVLSGRAVQTGTWRRRLSPEQVAEVEKVAAEELRRLGYLPSVDDVARRARPVRDSARR